LPKPTSKFYTEPEEVVPKTILPLEELTLKRMKISKLQSLVPIISDSFSLKSLNLASNVFGKDGLDPICAAVMMSPSLKYLDLSYNNLSIFAIRLLSETFKTSMSLLDVKLKFITVVGDKKEAI